MDEGGKVPDETVGQLGDWVDETAVTGVQFVAWTNPWFYSDKKIMTDRWPILDEDLQRWRREVIEALCACEMDCVVFSHFIAINAAVGHAAGDDRVVSFRPDNCSITIMETRVNTLTLLERGVEAVTEVR